MLCELILSIKYLQELWKVSRAQDEKEDTCVEKNWKFTKERTWNHEMVIFTSIGCTLDLEDTWVFVPVCYALSWQYVSGVSVLFTLLV